MLWRRSPWLRWHRWRRYIIVGSICERITFGAFLLAEMFVGAILYPVFGCWVRGGGWLSQLGSTMNLGHGYVDFAGSTVVHAVGGFCAMALSVVQGRASASSDLLDEVQSWFAARRDRPAHWRGRREH